jgi:hypothetical protein
LNGRSRVLVSLEARRKVGADKWKEGLQRERKERKSSLWERLARDSRNGGALL